MCFSVLQVVAKTAEWWLGPTTADQCGQQKTGYAVRSGMNKLSTLINVPFSYYHLRLLILAFLATM